MSPSDATESRRTFSLTRLSPVYHAIEHTPIQMVAVLGVWNRGSIRAKYRGIAPCAAIERTVRVVGRIVVWVDARADVSTAKIKSRSHGGASTAVPSALRTSSECADRNSGPWTPTP